MAGSSRDPRAQQVMNVQDPDHDALRADHEQAVTGRSWAFIACSASAASASGPMVLGARVITSFTVRASNPGPIARRRSPSVMMPRSAPPVSTTPRQPKRFSVISTSARSIGVPASASGTASPSCIRSRTRRSRAPSRPPGWKPWKSASVKPRRFSIATASASPRAICMVVDVVGARPIGQASAAGGSSNVTSAARASADPARAVIATSFSPKRRAWATRSASSTVSPEFDNASTGVPRQDHPKVAVRRLRRMHEQGGRSGRGEGRGDFPRHVAGFSHAGNHDPPRHAREAIDRGRELRPEGGGERVQTGRFRRQHVPGGLDIEGNWDTRAILVGKHDCGATHGGVRSGSVRGSLWATVSGPVNLLRLTKRDKPTVRFASCSIGPALAG